MCAERVRWYSQRKMEVKTHQLPKHVYNFVIVSGKSVFSLLYKIMIHGRMFFPNVFNKGHCLDLSIKIQKLLQSIQQRLLSVGIIWQNSHFMVCEGSSCSYYLTLPALLLQRHGGDLPLVGRTSKVWAPWGPISCLFINQHMKVL